MDSETGTSKTSPDALGGDPLLSPDLMSSIALTGTNHAVGEAVHLRGTRGVDGPAFGGSAQAQQTDGFIAAILARIVLVQIFDNPLSTAIAMPARSSTRGPSPCLNAEMFKFVSLELADLNASDFDSTFSFLDFNRFVSRTYFSLNLVFYALMRDSMLD
ncbi:hypothetical protein DFH09DRAFT_1316464 [Mycena vulgaris]|nr:hypothetical protein DFH09DRAFT_1316464 [Mycena vulgaris]